MSNRNAVSQSPIPPRLTDAVVTSAVPVRVLRLPEVIARVGLKRAAIYQHTPSERFPNRFLSAFVQWAGLKVKSTHGSWTASAREAITAHPSAPVNPSVPRQFQTENAMLNPNDPNEPTRPMPANRHRGPQA